MVPRVVSAGHHPGDGDGRGGETQDCDDDELREDDRNEQLYEPAAGAARPVEQATGMPRFFGDRFPVTAAKVAPMDPLIGFNQLDDFLDDFH